MIRKKILSVISLIFILHSVLFAQPEILNMDYAELDNGTELLNVYYDVVPLVNVVIVVKTGLKDENPELNGVSHMLEHMLFNGTEKRTQEELYDEIDKNGFYINAQTGDDYIAFTGLGEASQVETLIEIMSDMLFHSTFPVKKFDKEKGIIIAELERSENSPRYKKDLDEKKWLFEPPSIYRYPVLGSRESISNISRKKLIDFYQTHFNPENMIAVIYGPIKLLQAKQLISKYFPSKGAASTREMKNLSVSVKPGIRVFKDERYSRLQMKIPGPAPSDYLFPFFYLFNQTIFNQSSFFMNLIPDSLKKNMISVDVSFDYHPPNSFLLINMMSSDSLPLLKENLSSYKSLLDSILITFGNVASPDRIEQWLNQYQQKELINYDKPMYFAFLKSKLLSVLGGKDYLKLTKFLEQYKSQFSSYYSSYINQILRGKKYTSNHLFAGFKWDNSQKNKKMSNFSNDKKVKIYKRPGFPVLIAVQNKALPLSSVHILFKNRLKLERTDPGATELIHWLFGKQSHHFDQKQIDSLLSKYAIEVKWHDFYFIPYDDYYFSSEFGYVRSITLSTYQEKQLELLGELIQNVKFNEDIFERTRKELLYQVKKKEKNTIYTVKYRFFRKLSGGISPESYPPYGRSEDLNFYNPEKIKSIIPGYVSNENLIISVVSPEDPETVRDLVDMYFTRTEKHDSAFSLPDVKIPEPFTDSLPDPQKSTNHNFYAAFPLKGDYSLEDDVALEVLNRLISRQIQFEIREKKGWAYSIGTNFRRIGNNYFFICRGAVRKGTLDSTMQIIKNIILHDVTNGFEKKDIQIAQKSIVSGLLRRYSSSENLAYFWGYRYFKNKIQSKPISYDEINRYIDRYNKPIQSGQLVNILKKLDLNSLYLTYSY